MRRHGFTLIEALVVLAAAAVLAALAYPSLRLAVVKVHRGEALVALGHLQLAQADHRSRHRRYARLAELGIPATTPGGRYGLSESEPGPQGYTVTARALGAQAVDAACRYFRLQVDGADVRHASGSTGDAGNDDDANRRCWGNR